MIARCNDNLPEVTDVDVLKICREHYAKWRRLRDSNIKKDHKNKHGGRGLAKSELYTCNGCKGVFHRSEILFLEKKQIKGKTPGRIRKLYFCKNCKKPENQHG